MKLQNLCAVALMLGVTAVATGHEPMYVPQGVAPATVQSNYAPQGNYAPTPAGESYIEPVPANAVAPGTVLCDSCDNPGIQLYSCVKVHKARKIDCCAVPKIVSVPNPCYDPCNPCCTAPKCVFVEICVPPCGCEQVCCIRNGNGMMFSYGGYDVRVTSRRDMIIITYLG